MNDSKAAEDIFGRPSITFKAVTVYKEKYKAEFQLNLFMENGTIESVKFGDIGTLIRGLEEISEKSSTN